MPHGVKKCWGEEILARVYMQASLTLVLQACCTSLVDTGRVGPSSEQGVGALTENGCTLLQCRRT